MSKQTVRFTDEACQHVIGFFTAVARLKAHGAIHQATFDLSSEMPDVNWQLIDRITGSVREMFEPAYHPDMDAVAAQTEALTALEQNAKQLVTLGLLTDEELERLEGRIMAVRHTQRRYVSVTGRP